MANPVVVTPRARNGMTACLLILMCALARPEAAEAQPSEDEDCFRADPPEAKEPAPRGTRARGRGDVELGFSFAWRWLPNSDKGFWDELGELATPDFLAATGYVGVQIYPHLVCPARSA